jgi:serine/threonine protein kinase
MPEEELISYGKVAPALHSLSRTKVVRLSKTLAMKFGPTVLASEGETMRYVATKFPGVRLPRVYRYFNVNQSSPCSGVQGYIVMDYIDSPSLDTCWDELSLRVQQSVVEQVAAMVGQLQSVHCDHPGVIGGGISRGNCFSIYGSGPFPTKEAFQKWIDRKLYLSKCCMQASQDIIPLQCPYFVLVHGDLSPRNLVIDTCNQVWLIDWECAGFYPPIFEAASVKHQFQFKSFSQLLLPLIYNNPEELAQFEGCNFGIHRVFDSLPQEMELESEQ